MAQKIYLTAEEKILIHLYDYSKFRNQWEVPFNVTQEGIASAVGIARCNVSREIKKLREKNFIEERVAHIKGVVRKRKVYFLSMDGMSPAMQIKSHLENSDIKFRDRNGVLNDIKLTDINKFLDVRPTMLEIIKHVTPDNIVDYRALQVELTQEFLNFTDKAPKLKYFFGRTKEMESIKDMLEKDKIRVIVIQGIAGVGKTALASKLIAEYKKKVNVFWFKFYDWSTLHNLLTHLSDFLSTLNRTKLKSYMETVKRLDINEISEILTNDLKNLKALLIFDDFYKTETSDKIQQLFQSITDISRPFTGLKLIILTRQFIPFYTQKDTGEDGVVTEMSISGLDELSSNRLLEQRQIDSNKFKKIYELTKGHPLFLELVDPNETLDNLSLHSDVKKYIYSEIFMKLPEDARKLLGIASVYRQPIQSSVFFIETEITYDTIDGLIEKSLLNEHIGGYIVHDLVREFFYQRLTPPMRIKYHKAAADHYVIEFERLLVSAEHEIEVSQKDSAQSKDASSIAKKPISEVLDTRMDRKFIMLRRALQYCLEAQYHHLQAEEFSEAARLAISEGVKLISHGFLDEFSTNLSQFTPANVEMNEWTTIQILKGDIYTIQGDWDSALRNYQMALEKSLANGYNLKAAETYRNIGAIHFRRGDPQKAMNYLEKAMQMSLNENDYHGIANVNYWMGVVLNRQGEYDKAIEHFNTCMKYAEKINFLPGIAKTYTGISDVLVNKGEYEEAIKNYLKGIDILDRTGNIFEQSEVYNRIGITYCKQGGHEDDAIKYYSKRIDISKGLGDIRGEGYGLSNAAECYASKGQLETAFEYCNRAMKIFQKMDEKRMISNTLMVYGIVYGYKHEWNKSVKYFDDAMKIARSINSPDMQAQIYFNFGFTLRDMGDILSEQSGHASPRSASAISSSYDDTSGTFQEFDRPETAKDAYRMARENLNQAIELYRDLKNDVKVKRLSEELAKIPS